MTLLHFLILLPLIAAVIIPVVYKYQKDIHLGWFVLPVPFVIVSYLFTLIPTVKSGSKIYYTLNFMPKIGMNFDVYIDGLGLLFAILISGIGTLVVLYSIGYLSKDEKLGNFYVYLLMFMAAMLGVVTIDNVLMLYMFWELTSISSFLLIAFWTTKERSTYGAQKSMLITMFGGFMMLGGFILLSIITETFSIREMIASSDVIASNGVGVIALVLILLGAFTKSAQFPFYIWLPDAMEAPTPVSAYLHSATMVKAGLYLVARFTPVFMWSLTWVNTILIIGLITLAWASFNAVVKDDMKAVLAFSTVSQLGLIMSLLGLGALAVTAGFNEEIFTVAVIAAVFHIINHATFKGALFMVTGIVDHQTGTRSIKRLGALMTIMPISFTITLITAFSMAGLPPFNGFLSKEMFLEAMFEISQSNITILSTISVLFPLLAILGSIFTFVYSMKLIFGVFTGESFDTPKEPSEAPMLMLISPVILASLVVIIGLFPNILSNTIISPAASAILDRQNFVDVSISFWHGVTPALLSTILIVLVGALLYYFRESWMFIYDYIKERFTLNNFYDQSLVNSTKYSNKVTNTLSTGFLRTYLLYIFGFLTIFSIVTMFRTGLNLSLTDLAPIGIQEVILIVVILVSLGIIMITKSRMVSIIMLGAVGFSMALFFVFFRAPDLALTQLAIETVTTTLFLVCFYHLPKVSKLPETRQFKLTNFIVAVMVGAVSILIGLSAYSHRIFESISEYHIEHVYDLAAGKNMVNVILVDFRGYDTVFETVVFAIAGIGIYILMRMTSLRKDDENEEHT
ncbi:MULTISPECIES: Na+/H+ antiporter subunit A [unclassified Nosocomiicoccus]|uniref:Na+/H+ antiporter subunit A n=1 Tax=unclassified Nosocomiicoccus TaxID=2646683 RepID=UPI0008A1D6AD|nr:MULTISPECIES: Na+/H+ antiporter subunit A [unclassified Nosocomiicoccus]OFL49156.1 cation:proton antiporter [Nosocomiicoccus sp. HMSC067E10]OFO52744.1 cation:proton antiporter [Nosocomiicoccus sp. HMSC059G07]